MENKNILENKEKEILYEKINEDFKDLNEYGKSNIEYYDKLKEKNIKYGTEYFEVLTDNQQFWVSMDDLVRICKRFVAEQLISFDFRPDTEVVDGKNYVCVTASFLAFIKDNTYAPKYIPRFALLKAKERENDVKLHDLSGSLSQRLMVNGGIDIEYEEPSEKSR